MVSFLQLCDMEFPFTHLLLHLELLCVHGDQVLLDCFKLCIGDTYILFEVVFFISDSINGVVLQALQLPLMLLLSPRV